MNFPLVLDRAGADPHDWSRPAPPRVRVPAPAAARKRCGRQIGYRGTIGMEAFASGDPTAAVQAFREAFTVAD